MTSSAKRRSSSVKSLICSCHAQVVDEVALLREVLLDGRQLLEAAAARRQGLLERAVLEELLPVDLLDLLVLGPLLEVRRRARAVSVTPIALLAGRRRLRRARALDRLAVGAGARVDLVVGQDRVGVELLADLVDELEARKLQQADRLLQLRRHHELLAELELLLDLHR